jgi:predicted DCC family thiol-disulfide oxidoreductase YuxK
VAGLPPIDDEALNRAMHLVTPDGRVYRGAQSLPALLPYLPGGALLRPLFFIPGVLPVADRIYDRIAANRHRLGCGGDSCAWSD